MNLKKPKNGRSASQAIRADAARIVAEYREAQARTDGKTVIKCFFEGQVEDVVTCDSTDVEPLLQYLEVFAETGYFMIRDQEDNLFVDSVQLRNEFQQLRKKMRRDAAVIALASKWCVSTKTIDERLAAVNKILPKS